MTEATHRMHTVVAAAFKYPMGKPVMKALKEGDVLTLRREPTNQWDKDAIQVIGTDAEGNEVQLGYIPSIKAAVLASCHLVGCKKSSATWDAIVVEYNG